MMARHPGEALAFAIGPVRHAELDQVMAIERLSFRSPWARQSFEDEFKNDFSFIKVMRKTQSGEVVAFVNYWLVNDEIHVLNIATHPEWRRRGIGRRLMLHVLRGARARHARLVTLEVRRSNAAAIALYDELGFRPVGIRPRYYENHEDAIVMVLDL